MNEKEEILNKIKEFINLKIERFKEQETLIQGIEYQIWSKIKTLSINELMAFFNLISQHSNRSQLDILNLLRNKDSRLVLPEKKEYQEIEYNISPVSEEEKKEIENDPFFNHLKKLIKNKGVETDEIKMEWVEIQKNNKERIEKEKEAEKKKEDELEEEEAQLCELEETE